MLKDKLIASSGSLEGIQKLISQYLYGSTITLTDLEDDLWAVSNAKGLLPHYAVILSKGKYKFVELSEPLDPEILNESIIQESVIKILKEPGYIDYLTALDKKAIVQILDAGALTGTTKKKKIELIPIDINEDVYEVVISNWGVWTYGANPSWDTNITLIQYRR